MSVQHRIFASSTKAWEALCAEASAFASEIGREKLINISVAASGGDDIFGRGGSGVIVVWYWGVRATVCLDSRFGADALHR